MSQNSGTFIKYRLDLCNKPSVLIHIVSAKLYPWLKWLATDLKHSQLIANAHFAPKAHPDLFRSLLVKADMQMFATDVSLIKHVAI